MSVDASDLGGGVRMLTLNRPPANAISREFNEELFERCRQAREDHGVRAVIVTGAGSFFSGGVDIKEAAGGKSMVRNLGGSEIDGVFALWTMPKPTVAMINGHAIAGGLIIALACDFRITCAGHHKLGLNETAIGLPFPPGAVEIARLGLGSRGLRYGLLEAGMHEPPRALELGFVDEITEPSGLKPRCLEMAGKLAGYGLRAYAYTKRSIQRDSVARVLAATDEEIGEIGEIARSEETRSLITRQAAALSRK